MNKLTQSGILFILILFANIALANDCNVRYDHEPGDVSMPCVMDESGNYYGVVMQRKSNGDFQVIFVDKFDKPQFPVELQKVELIGENLLLLMVNYIIPAGSCPQIVENFSTDYDYLLRDINNNIQVQILQNSSLDATCDLHLERSITAAQVVKVLPGVTHDIYINGELKETVKVPTQSKS